MPGERVRKREGEKRERERDLLLCSTASKVHIPVALTPAIKL